MKKFFPLVLLASLAHASGGDFVGNGASFIEIQTQVLFTSIRAPLELCLNSSECGLTETEATWLRGILDGLDRESDRIYFESEKQTPGFFLIEGEVKAAKTGLGVGSPIYLNRDFVNADTSTAFLIALLVHELGHHLGVRDHRALDLLGSKVAHVASARTQTGWHYSFPKLGYQALASPHVDHFALLWRGQNAVIDLGYLFRRALCGGDPATTLHYVNLHWGDRLTQVSSSRYEFPLEGRVMYHCENSNIAASTRFLVSVPFDMIRVPDRHEVDWQLVPLELRVTTLP